MIAMGAAPQIYAASIGIQDSLFLMILALIVFGPRRLPEIGRQIGKLMYEFRKVSNDFKFQMEEELRAAEEADRQRKLQASLPPPAASTTPELPPHPVVEAEPEPAPFHDAPYAVPPEETAARALESEMRGEPSTVPASPQIQPPSTGEQVAAARPFRASNPSETETPASETPAQLQPGIQPETAADSETHHG
jgi:sec-independent protein translocase protein TatB